MTAIPGTALTRFDHAVLRSTRRALGTTPAVAQTGSGTGDSGTPTTCNFRQDYYSCCPRYDPCTQIFLGDSALPPAEPSKPAEPPEA